MVRHEKTFVATTPHFPGDEETDAINQILGFHIRLAYSSVYRHFTETFNHLDLTQKQLSLLWLVGDHRGIAQTDLAQRLRMDRATTMAIVNRLQARDYLVRGKSLADKRKQTLNLTSAGQKILVAAKAAIQSHEAWLKSRFTDEDVQRLIELLSRIDD